MSLEHVKKAEQNAATGARPATPATTATPASTAGMSRESLQKNWGGEEFPDGGTLYAETDFTRPIVEPVNALTALAFLYVALWFWRRPPNKVYGPTFQRLISAGLFLGALGGALYHGLREHYGFMLLDVVPIFVVGLAMSLKALRVKTQGTDFWISVAIMAVLYGAAVSLYFSASHLLTNLAYALCGVAFLGSAIYSSKGTPKSWKLLTQTAGIFLIGFVFRMVDLTAAPWIPVGTHALWHLSGAAGTLQLLTWLESLDL